jgi:homoserine acetyltransferase
MAATWPEPTEGDFTIPNFIFQVGKSLPKLKIHYRAVGTPKKDSNGKTTNAVLVMHGTTSSSISFFRDVFAGKIFLGHDNQGPRPGMVISFSILCFALCSGSKVESSCYENSY